MKTLRLGFTGTQAGMTKRQRAELRFHLQRWLDEGYTHLEAHHGDCIGADADFHDICVEFWPDDQLHVVLHPPINEYKRAFKTFKHMTVRESKDFLVRNHDIVDETDGLIASPRELQEKLRSGTWATVRYGRKKDKPVIIMWASKVN